MGIISGFPGISQRYYLQPPWDYMVVNIGGNFYGYFGGMGGGRWQKIDMAWDVRETLVEVSEEVMQERLDMVRDGRK